MSNFRYMKNSESPGFISRLSNEIFLFTIIGLYLLTTPLAAQSYCAASGTLCDNRLANVTITSAQGGFNNSTGCETGNYGNYTSIVATLIVNTSYSGSTIQNQAGYVLGQVSIWVDWNNNFLFTDVGENIHNAGTWTGGSQVAVPFTITPPSGTTPGMKRMRVRSASSSGTLVPCGNTPIGEVEDYTINVITCAPAPTMPGPISGPTAVCIGASATYSVSAVAGATSYSWSVPTGTVITGGGSSNSMTVTVGSTSGNVSVSSINACGTSAPRTLAITVNPSPTVTVSPSSASICAGNSQALTAGGATTYSWAPPGGLSATTGSAVTASPTVTTTYTVTGTSSGCTATATSTITVNPAPSSPVAGSNSPLCEGTTLNLTASTVAGATYTWNGPNSFTSSAQNPSISNVTTAASGTYTVTAMAGSCSSMPATVTVVVDPVPPAPNAWNNSPLCNGTTLDLTADSIPGAAYSWTGPNGFTSAAQNPSIPNVTSNEAGTYFVTVSFGGCTSLPGATTVTVNPAPAPPTAGSNSPLCAGTTLNLTASTVAGATYNWTGPNLFVSTDQNPAIPNMSANEAGTYSVTVTVSGCTSAVATTNVMIGAGSTPVITASGPTTFCEGDSIVLSSSPAMSYLWSTGATTQSIWVLQSGTFTVDATDVGGCTGTSAGETVTVNPSPNITISGLNGGYCLSNTPVSLTGSPAGGLFTGPGISGNAFDPTMAGLGTHTIAYSYTDANGCGGSQSQSTIVSSNAFVSLGPDTMVCDDAPAFILYPGNFSSYLWQDNSTNSVFSVSAVTLGIGFHTFYVGITDANGCIGTDTTVVEVSDCTGSIDYENQQLTIFPNPTDGKIKIEFDNKNYFTCTFEIINLQGGVVYSGLLNSAGQMIDLSQFSNGVYFIKVTSGTKHTIIKIIKQ